MGELCYRCTKLTLAEVGGVFDFGHFWEDICFKNGPLINPKVFRQKVGPHYRRITELLHQHGITIVSLDCDGWIDALVPIWLENGVNIMFPIEVGTWNASIAPWREKYGRSCAGSAGCANTSSPRITPRWTPRSSGSSRWWRSAASSLPRPSPAADCKWDNVQYYCERMRMTFGG